LLSERARMPALIAFSRGDLPATRDQDLEPEVGPLSDTISHGGPAAEDVHGQLDRAPAPGLLLSAWSGHAGTMAA
jgi:hypothetical protein